MQQAQRLSSNKSNKFPNVKVHPHYMMNGARAFYSNSNVEVWNKVIHLLIYIYRTNGTIFISNTGIKRWLNDKYDANISIHGVKQAIRKLRDMGFVRDVEECEYHVKDENLRLTNGRILKLNVSLILDYLRVTDFDHKLYAKGVKKSRERRFIRKKMYSLVDWVNIRKNNLKEAYNMYVTVQQKKYFNPQEKSQEITLESYQMMEEEIYNTITMIYDETDVGVIMN